MPTKIKNIKLVQTTDFFYPLVEDPYMQGKIACANVLSDLYSMGLVDCDNMLMILGVSRKMSPVEREIAIKLIIKGFNDAANEAGCLVTGGQTVLNPWVIIGGVATSVVEESQIILPVNAQPGDVLVLTKPLGTQVAVNSHQWLRMPEKWKKVEGVVTEEEVKKVFRMATTSMARLNRVAAKLMHKYQAHAATDVTGFGILGHAQNLAGNQKLDVDFIIHTLPILHKMKDVNQVNNFKLMAGYSAETSGGLFIAMSKENAFKFIEEIQKEEGYTAWIIGDVVAGSKKASIIENPTIIDVTQLKQTGLSSKM